VAGILRLLITDLHSFGDDDRKVGGTLRWVARKLALLSSNLRRLPANLRKAAGILRLLMRKRRSVVERRSTDGDDVRTVVCILPWPTSNLPLIIRDLGSVLFKERTPG